MKGMMSVFLMIGVCALPAAASAQSGDASVYGFGGVTFSTSDFGGESAAASLGGGVSKELTPNLHIVGEGGWMSDIKPSIYELLDLTSVDFRVSGWYAQGGLRVIAPPHLTVRPYGEATAGFARLHTSLSGLSGFSAAIVDTSLDFLNRTDPMLGVGAGIMLGSGPLAVDIGYRYKRILASGVQSALNAGRAYQVNEARLGLGIRF